MKKVKIYGLLLAVLFLGFSCSDSPSDSNSDNNNNGNQTENPDNNSDNEDPQDPEETTVEEDIQNIELSLENMVSLLEDLEGGDFSETLKVFLGANGGDFGSEEWAETVVSGLESIVDVQATEDNSRFNFASHTGLYAWNSGSGSWSETSSSNNIVLEFPSSENSSNNDMTLTISEYADAATTIEGDQIYLPTRIQSKLEKNGTVIFRFNLNEITYSSNSDWPIPGTVDIEIFTAPFTHNITLSKGSNTNFQFDFSVADGDDLITSISVELDLAHSNYANLNEEDFENLSGSVKLTGDLTVDFDADLGMLISLDDPSENQINSFVSAEVSYKGVKIGDLEYSESEENIVIYYKDGSSDTVDRYYEDFLEDLEIITYPYAGSW